MRRGKAKYYGGLHLLEYTEREEKSRIFIDTTQNVDQHFIFTRLDIIYWIGLSSKDECIHFSDLNLCLHPISRMHVALTEVAKVELSLPVYFVITIECVVRYCVRSDTLKLFIFTPLASFC